MRVRSALAVAAMCLALLTSRNADACSKSWGDSEKDREHAKKICEIYKSGSLSDIETIVVKESIVSADVTKLFYRAMVRDKVAANKFVSDLMGGLRALTGRKAVTAWIYVEKVKVVEGDTTWTGEIKVRFLIE